MNETTPTTRRALRQAEVLPAQRGRVLTRRELRELEAQTGPQQLAEDAALRFVPAPLESPEAPFGSPAVLRNAPVLPALPPLAATAEPVEPLVVADPLTLAERIAALPVAPGAVDLVLDVLHPAVPLDDAPFDAALDLPVIDAAVPQPAPLPAAVAIPLPARPARSVAAPARSARADAAPAKPAAPSPEGLAAAASLAMAPKDPDTADLLETGRRPGPRESTWALWLGVASVVVWPLGPLAIVVGGWTLRLARVSNHTLVRPITGLVGGMVGTVLGVLFLTLGS